MNQDEFDHDNNNNNQFKKLNQRQNSLSSNKKSPLVSIRNEPEEDHELDLDLEPEHLPEHLIDDEDDESFQIHKNKNKNNNKNNNKKNNNNNKNANINNNNNNNNNNQKSSSTSKLHSINSMSESHAFHETMDDFIRQKSTSTSSNVSDYNNYNNNESNNNNNESNNNNNNESDNITIHQSKSKCCPCNDRTLAIISGFGGWTLDAFDFFLVVYCTHAIAETFSRSNKDIVLSITITLATRPIGAFIFGYLADRYGRKVPLITNLLFFSLAQLLTAVSPNYESFMFFRALFGLGMGGEWGASSSLTMEKAKASHRGWISGLMQEGYALGNMLAAIVFLTIFPYTGWRVLFCIGTIPAILILFVRIRMEESEIWKKNQLNNNSNTKSIFRNMLSNWKLYIYLVLFLAALSCLSHGTQDLWPTFLKEQFGLSSQARAGISILTSFSAVLGGIIIAGLSDRFGRKRAMLISYLCCLPGLPFWLYFNNLYSCTLGACWIQFFVQGAWGVVPAHVAELSPSVIRGLLTGLAYQCGVLIAAPLPYVQEASSEVYDRRGVMGVTVLVVLVLNLVVTGVGPEKKMQNLDENDDSNHQYHNNNNNNNNNNNRQGDKQIHEQEEQEGVSMVKLRKSDVVDSADA